MIHIFDTESVGFYGPIMLIQYKQPDGAVVVYCPWDNPVGQTLDLIESFCSGEVIGFNLAHDWFQLTKEYNIYSQLPRSKKPNVQDYIDIIETHPRDFCLKPKLAIDLLVYAQRSELQGAMGQDDLVIKKIPAVLANQLIIELHNRTDIPEIFFSGYKTKLDVRWKIVQLNTDGGEWKEGDEVDPNFVHIKLRFNASLSLKNLIKTLTGREVTKIEDLPNLPKPEEWEWRPTATAWSAVFYDHLNAWQHDTRRIKYAEDDVIYTEFVWNYFGRPMKYDINSNLTTLVGGSYWRGFDVDSNNIDIKFKELKEKTDGYKLNVNAPAQCLRAIQTLCSPMEKVFIKNTKAETLEAVSKWDSSAGELAKEIIEQRTLLKELDLLNKLKIAGRFFAMFKVVGTKSNRMAGGSLEGRGGSINPQGIKRGSYIRSIFIFNNNPEYETDGGDFDGFEVSIAEAVFNDPDLRRELLSGKKFHAIFGSVMYDKSYEEVLATKNDENGMYNDAKTAVFAWFYGAELKKLSETLKLSEEIVFEKLKLLEEKYPGIRIARESNYEKFQALRQPGGIGTAVEWIDPQQYVESFMGWKRFFNLEFKLIRSLWDIANKPSNELMEVGKQIKVVRRDRQQTGAGACRSAVFGAAFSLQSRIMRAANNHIIQSPGAEINKELQAEIWQVQPAGISKWLVQIMNVHDELICVTHKSVGDKVEQIVNSKVNSFIPRVPLIKMKWKRNLKDWGEK